MLRSAVLLLAALLSHSCNSPAAELSESLVGAKELPSADTLSRETLHISSGGSDWGGDALSYELHPDNSLTVTHTYSDDRSAGEVVKGRETLQVSPDIAVQVKRLLWRVRPGQLEGVDRWPARPVGCERKGPHDFGEVAVVFINNGSTGIEDDQVGIFEMPSAQSCNTPAAVEARGVVRRALELLPKSKVAAEFELST